MSLRRFANEDRCCGMHSFEVSSARPDRLEHLAVEEVPGGGAAVVHTERRALCLAGNSSMSQGASSAIFFAEEWINPGLGAFAI